jgi:hypothetical protein
LNNLIQSQLPLIAVIEAAISPYCVASAVSGEGFFVNIEHDDVGLLAVCFIDFLEIPRGGGSSSAMNDEASGPLRMAILGVKGSVYRR